MENRYKALIKQELKSVRWIFVYFCIICSLFIIALNKYVYGSHVNFMEYQLQKSQYRTWNMVSYMNGYYSSFMIAIAIGVILLVIMQFKAYKDRECGRFLKSLPIKNEKYLLTKIVCGILSYTIPFILVVCGVYWIKDMNSNWIDSLYNMVSIKKIYDVVNSNGYIAQVLMSYYFIMTTFYMFLVFMQYIISWPKISVIIGSIITVAPFYLALNVNDIIINYNSYSGRMPFQIDEILVSPWWYGLGSEFCSSGGWTLELGIDYINQIELKLVILVVLSIIFFGLAYMKSKYFRIEELDILMSSKLTRILFCMGVTICSAFIPTFIVDRIIYLGVGLSLNVIIASIICIILGSCISLKIARFGSSKKGGVGYEEV